MHKIVTASIYRFSATLFLLATLCSCSAFTEGGVKIYEFISFQNNGSGKFEIVVDLSEAKKFTTIERYLIERGYTQKVAQRNFQNTAQKLSHVAGVHKVCVAHDQALLHFKLGFSFDSLRALNKAMRTIFLYIDSPNANYFAMNAHAFMRLDTKSIARLVDHYQTKDNTYVASFDLQIFFGSTVYKTIYTFDKEIKKCSNKLAKLSRDRRTIVVEHLVFDEREQELSIGNKILF